MTAGEVQASPGVGDTLVQDAWTTDRTGTETAGWGHQDDNEPWETEVKPSPQPTYTSKTAILVKSIQSGEAGTQKDSWGCVQNTSWTQPQPAEPQQSAMKAITAKDTAWGANVAGWDKTATPELSHWGTTGASGGEWGAGTPEQEEDWGQPAATGGDDQLGQAQEPPKWGAAVNEEEWAKGVRGWDEKPADAAEEWGKHAADWGTTAVAWGQSTADDDDEWGADTAEAGGDWGEMATQSKQDSAGLNVSTSDKAESGVYGDWNEPRSRYQSQADDRWGSPAEHAWGSPAAGVIGTWGDEWGAAAGADAWDEHAQLGEPWTTGYAAWPENGNWDQSDAWARPIDASTPIEEPFHRLVAQSLESKALFRDFLEQYDRREEYAIYALKSRPDPIAFIEENHLVDDWTDYVIENL